MSTVEVKPKTADRLREVRQDAGLSQTELARLTGMHQPDISDFETGARILGPDCLLRIARALKINPFYITGESDEKNLL